MKISEREIAELVINLEPVIETIILKSKDVEGLTLWCYITYEDLAAQINVHHYELWAEPKIGGINFGQKCLTRDQVFKKLLDCIES